MEKCLFVSFFYLNHLTGLDGIETYPKAIQNLTPHLNHLTGLDGIETESSLIIETVIGLFESLDRIRRD